MGTRPHTTLTFNGHKAPYNNTPIRYLSFISWIQAGWYIYMKNTYPAIQHVELWSATSGDQLP